MMFMLKQDNNLTVIPVPGGFVLRNYDLFTNSLAIHMVFIPCSVEEREAWIKENCK